MVDNGQFKATVRRFAEINQVNYTTALRQFTPDGYPLFKLIQPKRNSPFSERDWAKSRGLQLGNVRCFHVLAEPTLNNHQCFDLYDFARSRTWDHRRSYTAPRKPGKAYRTPAAITFASYAVWEQSKLQDEVAEVIAKYGVRGRIGFARDVAYGSGATPILFWNPDVFDPA